MRILVKTCAGRERYIDYLVSRIPNLEVIRDRKHDAMDTFCMALEATGDDEAIHLEDDIVVPEPFHDLIVPKIRELQAIFGADRVIQFYRSGTRGDTVLMPGSSFLWAQCVYFPPGDARDLLNYHRRGWRREAEHPDGVDLMVADWLKDAKRKYIYLERSFVQHREGKSAIDPRRSTKRQSGSASKGPLP